MARKSTMEYFKNKIISSTNWLGVWTLMSKETLRFIKVSYQTILAPVVTNILFFSIFLIVIDRDKLIIGGVQYTEFLVPGLIMMAILQNAFMNTSSSIMISKIQGNIVDILLPPLSNLELTIAITVGGVARGMVVGLVSVLVFSFLIDMKIINIFYILFFSLSGSLALSLLGVMGGIWADKFDHMAGLTNFIITPLTFLSGSFYSIDKLPDILKNISELNPFFYIIDGFRYGFLGVADGSVKFGLFYLIILSCFTWFAAYILFKKGYKIKS